MKGEALAGLAAAVQTNCHIADARHAADMTLCSYLLQMREFHRWERGLPFGAALARDAVGAWIAERETLWSTLEEEPYRQLPGGPSGSLDPFDVAAVNACVQPAGLLYGAGLVSAGRPVFFLAQRHGHERREGVPVHSAGRELARGLVAPPAVLSRAGGEATIVLRRESLARWCWERFEAWTLRRSEATAFAAVVRAWGLDEDFDAALPRWLDAETELLVLHELGEVRAGEWLGDDWAVMRLALPTRRADLYARAVRDHLADLGFTLPVLLDRGEPEPLHGWFANFDGVRRLLFPALASAYEAWRGGDAGSALRRAIAQGDAHFRQLAQRVLALHAADAAGAGAAVESCLTADSAICGD